MKGLLSIDDAAKFTSVSRETIRRLVGRRVLEPVRLGRRLLIPISQIESLVANGYTGRTTASDRRCANGC